MSEEQTAGPALPAAVRDRVVALAADALGVLPATDVPARLRSVARFAPRQRAKRGAVALWSVLESDPAFVARIAEVTRSRLPDLTQELDAGAEPTVADPVETAAVAYVLRAPGWPDRVAAAEAAAGTAATAAREVQHEVVRLREQLDTVRAQGRTALDSQKAETAKVQAEARALRKSVADARRAVAAAESVRLASAAAADEATADAGRRVAAAESEARRLRERVSELERAVGSARRDLRSGRSAEDIRLRLLLDTLLESANGLRRELALPPVQAGERPADAVASELVTPGRATGAAQPHNRARAADDPALLDGLLALPQVHLLVDGYNVTKSGYGTLPLDAQRNRLLTGLAALAARTAAEVTCVFDGADLDQPVPGNRHRLLRVIFSPAGTTADEVIRRLVREEPQGRPVVVVSSDQEVVDGVRASGARAVPSTALLQRLERG